MQGMKKKIVCLIMTLALCLALLSFSGCNRRDTKVAFFVYDGTDTFISETMEYMIANIPNGISASVYDAGKSQAVQNQQIVELIDEGGFDMFIVNAVDRLACSSIVEKCSIENIPLILFNREPLADALEDGNVFYVGADPDKQGERQADMVAELFTENFADTSYDKNGDGIVQLVIIKGEQGHQDAEKRTATCVSRMKELGFKVEVLATEIANWNRQEGYQAMAQLMAKYGSEIELVFSNNDDMALGAIDYLTSVGAFRKSLYVYRQPFVIVGVDGTAVGLDAIGSGLLYGTVDSDSIKQADAVLAMMEYVISNKSMDTFPYTITNNHYIYIVGDTITRENLGDYVK